MEIRERIEAEQLAEEIRLGIEELFEAEMHEYKNTIEMAFGNGQNFSLVIYEEEEDAGGKSKCKLRTEQRERTREERAESTIKELLRMIAMQIEISCDVKPKNGGTYLTFALENQEYAITVQKR